MAINYKVTLNGKEFPYCVEILKNITTIQNPLADTSYKILVGENGENRTQAESLVNLLGKLPADALFQVYADGKELLEKPAPVQVVTARMDLIIHRDSYMTFPVTEKKEKQEKKPAKNMPTESDLAEFLTTSTING